jgi:hypothetical protein
MRSLDGDLLMRGPRQGDWVERLMIAALIIVTGIGSGAVIAQVAQVVGDVGDDEAAAASIAR